MYLSDRDLKFAVEARQLIVSPPPSEYDTTSIDLHLDNVEEAKTWDVKLFQARQVATGNDPWLQIGSYHFRAFSHEYCRSVPSDPAPEDLVYRNADRVILKPGGFFLWQTREEVGTPEDDPRLICFVNERVRRRGLGC